MQEPISRRSFLKTAAFFSGAAALAGCRDVFRFDKSAKAKDGCSEIFFDPCKEDWRQKWFLDGLKAKITNGSDGMDFWAGPTAGDNSCHAVLWTKHSFAGNIKIEYEYTKLDDERRYVTILYIEASGSGHGPYRKDISEWSDLRTLPSMELYYNHMNTYHIAYAAYENNNNDPREDYIRARRYMPETQKALNGTELEPSYYRTGLFRTGVPHKITVIKTNSDLYMNIKNDEKEMLCHWKNAILEPIFDGRIGLRHMCTRGARYKNFCVSALD
jgi:hypothetical protein